MENLQAVTKLPGDSSKRFNPAWTPGSSQMLSEKDPAVSQAISEVLAKNLSNLTLLSLSTKFPPLLPECSPQQQDIEKSLQGLRLGLSQGIPYRMRHGVRRILAAAPKERMQRMLVEGIKYRTFSASKRPTGEEN